MSEWHRRYAEWFHNVAAVYWDYWRQKHEGIRDAAQWRQHRNYLKAVFIDALGGLPPQRTAVNARTIKRLELDGYAIELVIFESLPGLLVTANVYVPANLQDRAPAVLVACGHSENGKAAEPYRRVCTSLALKGYVVLIYDPIGQGERYMYLDDAGQPLRGPCTSQHTHLGVQIAAAGLSMAGFMVWDSMRAIDYLLSRPDVAPGGVGMTGCSGGGTNTAYTAALDERVVAAMPVCYITSLEERQRSEKIADYEQNLYGQILRGLDHADLIAMVAPRAVCVGAASEDFFPIAGAQASYQAAREIYELLGVADRCELLVVEGAHGFLPQLRRGAYAFFNRWLGGRGDDEEPDVPMPDGEDLCCLGGRAAGDAATRTVISVARKIARELNEHSLTGEGLLRELELRIGYVPGLVQTSAPRAAGDGVEVVEVVSPIVPPLEVARRADAAAREVLVTPSSEEAIQALEAGQARAAVVLPLAQSPALDARAELAASLPAPARFPWTHSAEAFCAFYAQLLGRDWPFVRAAQLLCGLEVLGRGPFALTAHGALSIPVIYAAAVHPAIAEANLAEPLWSYRDVLEQPLHVLSPGEVVWGWAGSHDLPDVMALVAPRRLRVIRPRGADGRLLREDELNGLQAILEAYSARGQADNFALELPEPQDAG